ncbi:GNAT family N-acetyltransferase [Natranaerobius thermophilus]|nr:GNAT family protein [Natranaerobius thermophilus]
MNYYKKLIGTKVYLSPVNPEDYEKYTEWVNDLEISINLSFAYKIFSEQQEKEMLQQMSKDGYQFAVVKKDAEELIGNCGLHNVDLINRSAELGIFIGDKNCWDGGYGVDAVNLLLDYAFNLLNLNSVYLRVHSFNDRAIQCYKKCGFKEIGRRREAYIIGGNKYDDVYMDILASEFEYDSQIIKYI